MALQSKLITYTVPYCLTQLSKVSLILQIPENLICSRANSSQTGESMRVIPLLRRWMDVCVSGGLGGQHKDMATPHEDFILVSSAGGNDLWCETLKRDWYHILRSCLTLE